MSERYWTTPEIRDAMRISKPGLDKKIKAGRFPKPDGRRKEFPMRTYWNESTLAPFPELLAKLRRLGHVAPGLPRPKGPIIAHSRGFFGGVCK